MRHGWGWKANVGALSVATLLAAGSAAAQGVAGRLSLVSVSSDEVQGNQESEHSSVSADGRFVAFVSLADNLVPEDTNGTSDIFVRDRLLGTTQRVSVSSRGREGNASSGLLNGLGAPSISGDGRFVAFDSDADNLVGGDRNGGPDVFVHDRLTGETTRISVAADGTGGGNRPTISRDGRYVAFLSDSASFVPDGNFATDLFLADRQTGTIERISQGPGGVDANSGVVFPAKLSADARFVFFSTFAGNLVAADIDRQNIDAYLYDRQTGTMTAVTSLLGSPESNFVQRHGQVGGISADGRYMTFTTDDNSIGVPDTNGFGADTWLYDRVSGSYERVGLSSAGLQGDDDVTGYDVSDDGRFVLLETRSTNFGGPTNFRHNIYLRDRSTGTTTLMSVADDGTFGDLDSDNPAMTPAGDGVVFQSRASTFVPEAPGTFWFDIFVRDLRAPADLSVAQTDTPDPVPAREHLTYVLTVSNAGPGTATGVRLEDVLPAELFVSVTPSTGTCVRAPEKKTNGVVSCELGTLAPGQSATVTLVIRPAAEGTLSNAASVAANEPDPDPSDNSSLETTTVGPRL